VSKEEKMSKFPLLHTIEKYLKPLAIIISSLYILGLIIINIYLWRFGIYDISPLRIQYILGGFCFVLFISAPILIIVVPCLVWISLERLFYKILLAFFSLFASCAILILILWFMLYDQTYSLWGNIVSLLENYKDFILHLGLIIVSGLYVLRYVLRQKKSNENFIRKKRFKIIISAIALLYFFSSFFSYALYIQPKVHKSFGGGRPILADILISPEGVSIVNSLEMDPDDKGYLRDIRIIYETTSTIYLLPKKEVRKKVCSIAIPKKIIDGTRFLIEWPKENNQKK
jgi:hypothetical protein